MAIITETPRRRVGHFATVSAVAVAWVLAVIVFAVGVGVRAAPVPAAGQIRVHYIDVGHGDAILIQSARNAVLIDGGEYGSRGALVAYLRGVGVGTLDYVVATHPHNDHIGGLGAVIRRFDVKGVIMTSVTNNTKAYERLLENIEKKGIAVTVPAVGDRFTAGAISLVVVGLGPTGGDMAERGWMNNKSIVLRMAHGSTTFLFTGDAEARSEMEMLGRGQNLRSDVLKAGHHGGKASTTVKFLNAVRPSVVVVSCGAQDDGKHPHKQFLRRVEKPKRGIALYRTDRHGTVVITTDGKRIDTYTVRR